MVDDLDDLIRHLEFEDPTIAKSLKRGQDVVPTLIKRLENLLAATARFREQVAAIQKAWDAWYEESNRLHDEHGSGVDLEPYRIISSASLPDPSAIDDYYSLDDLTRKIVEALHKLDDQRAAPVITAALVDPGCMHVAAEALRDIRFFQAAPALLDAVTLVSPNHPALSCVLDTLQDYGVSRTQVRERFEIETSPQGRVNLMHLLTELPDDGTDEPDKSQIEDSLIFLALDNRDDSVVSGAITRFDKINNCAGRKHPFSYMEAPPADIVRSAIRLAASGNPPGHSSELRRRVRHFAHTPSVARAVAAVLTQQAPEPTTHELRLALDLALAVNTFQLDDPMRLTRALHRLSSHPEFGDRALLALRRNCWDLLFPHMVLKDDALRDEARVIFQAIATPDEHTSFARFTASRPGRWSKLLRWFKRR